MRPHVGPHLVDVRDAVAHQSLLPLLPPARGHVAVGGPDRVLLLLIHHHAVDGLIVVEVEHPHSFQATVASSDTAAVNSSRNASASAATESRRWRFRL